MRARLEPRQGPGAHGPKPVVPLVSAVCPQSLAGGRCEDLSWAQPPLGAWRCCPERRLDVVPGQAGRQQDRDDVGRAVPELELLADLIAGSVGGKLVEHGLGAGGTIPCRGLGRGFAAMIAWTWAA